MQIMEFMLYLDLLTDALMTSILSMLAWTKSKLFNTITNQA